MALPDPKETLIEYLQTGRDAMVWKASTACPSTTYAGR